MATEVISENEVSLNSVRYPLIGQVKPILMSVFPQKTVTGAYTKASDPNRDTWVISDQRGGLLVEEMAGEADADRFWWSTCITDYKGHIVLPRLATSVTAAAVNDGGYTVVLRPNAAGNETAMDGVTGATTHWEAVDEEVSDDDTTFVYVNAGNTKRDLFKIPNPNLDGTITSVTVYARCRRTADTANVQLSVRTNSVTYDSANQAITGTYALYSNAWTTNPNTSAAWTWAEINALEIGAELAHAAGSGVSRCTQIYAIVACTGDSRFRRTMFCNFAGKKYMSRGTKLYKLNTAGTGYTAVKEDFTNDITALVPTVNHLYVFEGENQGYWYLDADDTITQASITGDLAIWWDDKLFRLTHFNALSYTATPATATPSFTANGTIPVSPGACLSLFLYRDSGGDDVICAATKEGLWVHDFANSKWLASSLAFPNHPNGGKGVCVWRDSAYISSGLDVFQYTMDTPVSIRSVGLNDRDGLPPEYNGEIVKLLDGYNDLFALVDSTESTGTSTSTLMAWDGKAWRCWWVGDSTEKAMSDAIISSDFAYRLWFDHNDTVYYIPLIRGLRNPLKITTTDYATSGVHITPWYVADWEVGSKLALSIVNNAGRDVSADETIVVKYRIDHATTAIASTWTTLGTITGSGETTYTFGSSLGTAFKAIQFRFELARGSTTTETPDLLYAVFYFKKVLPVKWGWRFTGDCTHDHVGKSPDQLLDALVTAAELGTLVPFVYGDATKYVEVRSVEGERLTGRGRRGTYSVLVTEL